MLKRREESDIYLTHICRHLHSGDSVEKRRNMRSFQSTLWLSLAIDSGDSPEKRRKISTFSQKCDFHQLYQLLQATVLAESSSYFFFSPGYLCYKDVYRRESGRCCSLPFFLKLFIRLQNENNLNKKFQMNILQHVGMVSDRCITFLSDQLINHQHSVYTP